ERTGDRSALQEAVTAYRVAREAWASMAQMAKTIYEADVTYGPNANLRGHWLDRLVGIDRDPGDMEKRLAPAGTKRQGKRDPGGVRLPPSGRRRSVLSSRAITLRRRNSTPGSQ